LLLEGFVMGLWESIASDSDREAIGDLAREALQRVV
jgi:hypothetical protein